MCVVFTCKDEAEEGEGGDREKRTAQSFVTTTTAASVAMVTPCEERTFSGIVARLTERCFFW